MDSLKLQAYGKINLSLDVLRLRDDGYHDVRMIMQSVRLHDSISIRRSRQPGIRLKTNLPFLPVNENNLMYRAAKLLTEECGITDGVELSLRKVIPVAAGMAGGSADAASVLYGMNRIFRLGLKPRELEERGVKLGADIPFCLRRGTMLSEGIGEMLTALPPMPRCRIVLAKPAISVSTKYVYTNLHVAERPKEAHPDVDAAIAALQQQDLTALSGSLGNILECVTCTAYPEIEALKKLMRDNGAMNAMMSGSGPTVFGIFRDSEKAESCYKLLRYGRGKSIARQVYLTEPYNPKV